MDAANSGRSIYHCQRTLPSPSPTTHADFVLSLDIDGDVLCGEKRGGGSGELGQRADETGVPSAQGPTLRGSVKTSPQSGRYPFQARRQEASSRGSPAVLLAPGQYTVGLFQRSRCWSPLPSRFGLMVGQMFNSGRCEQLAKERRTYPVESLCR